MKRMIKILPILMTVLMVLTSCGSVLASAQVGNVYVNPTTKPGSTDGIQTMGNNILGLIQVIGSIIAVGVLMVVGIKYLMGSAEEKAEYKKVMVPYIVGAVILFGAVNIASWVSKMKLA